MLMVDRYLLPSGKLTLMPDKFFKVLLVVILVILFGILINAILNITLGDFGKQLLTFGLPIGGIVIVLFVLFRTWRSS